MLPIYRFRGRDISASDLEVLRTVLEQSRDSSRREVSRRVCKAWNWVQPNGLPRDMVCRSLLLDLERTGIIELPPKRCSPPNNVILRRKPKVLEVDQSPLETDLKRLGSLEWRQVRRTVDEPLFESLLDQHHYLGTKKPVGEALKFLVLAQGRPIACFAWSSPPLRLTLRDRFLGWSIAAREKNRNLLAYNLRFLIVPWVKVQHLASHLLGHMARVLPREWQRVYGHEVYYLETFVDTERFLGTCYKAANWISHGLTEGRGNNAPTRVRTRSIKEILGYPLTEDFREVLGRIA